MNADLISILTRNGQSIVEKIRANLQETGTNATGKTSRSLRYEVIQLGSKFTLKVYGRPFFATVETGRKPTPQFTKPSAAFVESIREWAEAKGVSAPAYAIAKAIHQKGTKLYREGGRKDVVSNVINQSLTDKISREILSKFEMDFIGEVKRIFGDGNYN